jgi:hypothetical protein
MLITDTIRKYIPAGSKATPSGWISFNCPACSHKGHRPDTRKRGGLMFFGNGFSYNCFNCKFKTKWEHGSYLSAQNAEFMNYLNVPEKEINQCRISAFNSDEVVPTFKQSENTKTYALPPEAKKINELIEDGYDDPAFIKVLEYIANRNVKFVEWHDLYWANTIEFGLKKRFIIPMISNGHVLGWTARSIEPKPKQKYIAQVNKQMVFNNDLLYNDRKFCLISEGELCAISLSGTACMHNTMTQNQIDIYNSSEQIKIVIPDKDKSGKELMEIALDQNWYVSMPQWPEKDAGDAVAKYGRIAALTHIFENIQRSPLRIKLETKRYFGVNY